MMRDLQTYETKYYENYSFEKYQVSYRRKKILEILNHYQAKSILEVGCGLEPVFEHYPHFDTYTIVEPIESFVENARQKLVDQKNISIHQGTLEEKIELLQQQNFDFIIVSSLIHELENPDNLMTAIQTLVNKNTIVHLNVPNAKSFHNLLGVELQIIPNEFVKSSLANTFQRHHTFDLEKLILFATRYGYKIIDSGSYFFKPFTHRQMQLLLEHKIIDEAILDALYTVIPKIPEFGSEIFVNLQI